MRGGYEDVLCRYLYFCGVSNYLFIIPFTNCIGKAEEACRKYALDVTNYMILYVIAVENSL